MSFDSKYEVFIADCEKSKSLSYRLRYKAYCLESRFENPDQFKLKMEFDENDERSVHFVVRSRKTREWVGSVRLIIGSFCDIPSRKFVQAPKTHLGNEAAKEHFASLEEFTKVLEISRLSVLERFRKPGAGAEDRLEGITIMIGFLRAGYEYSNKQGYKHCFFTVAPALARILRRMHFHFCQVGSIVDYHGRRIPHYAYLPDFSRGLVNHSPALHNMFHRKDTYSSFKGAASMVVNDGRRSDIDENLPCAV